MIPATTLSYPMAAPGRCMPPKVAEELGIATIVVPPSAGIISAYGLIASDFVLFESMTHRAVADERAADVLRDVFRAMRARALERAAASGLSGRLVLSLTAEMRFVGQAFEVPVLFGEAELAALDAAGVRQRFGEAHHRVYFFGGEATKPIEFVSFRLGVVAPIELLPLLQEAKDVESPARPIRIFDSKAWQDARLLQRAHLPETTPWRARRCSRTRHLPSMCRPAGPPGATTTTTLFWNGADMQDRTTEPRKAGHGGRGAARPRRLCGHLPGARRHRPRDGHQAHPLLLLQYRARGPGRLGRAFRRAGQCRRAGRAHSHASGLDVRDLPACVAQCPIDRLQPGDFYINNDPYGGGSTCRTCSSSRRSLSTGGSSPLPER